MTLERKLTLLTPPRNEAGYGSLVMPGGEPEDLHRDFRSLEEEGLVVIGRPNDVSGTSYSFSYPYSLTEAGREFLRAHGRQP